MAFIYVIQLTIPTLDIDTNIYLITLYYGTHSVRAVTNTDPS